MKSKIKTAIKRTRAKLHKARSAVKLRAPGAQERVAHHAKALNQLTGGSSAPAAPTRGR